MIECGYESKCFVGSMQEQLLPNKLTNYCGGFATIRSISKDTSFYLLTDRMETNIHFGKRLCIQNPIQICGQSFSIYNFASSQRLRVYSVAMLSLQDYWMNVYESNLSILATHAHFGQFQSLRPLSLRGVSGNIIQLSCYRSVSCAIRTVWLCD